MTNVTLPNFVENIEKGFIVVGNTFVDACEIISISKINETAIMIKFGNFLKNIINF
jgi:large-conductance mechanosensitive channel